MDLITYALCKNSSASAASAAASSASAAQAAQNAAEMAQGLAEDAQEAAETARNAAQSAQSAAESAKSGAEAAKSDAETAKTTAETAAGNASDDADAAADSASAAAQSAQAAQEAAQALSGIGAEAQTLPPGSDATVTVQNGKIIYGIPAGQPGTGLPDATAEDAGKVPVVGADGSYALGDPVPQVDDTLTQAGAPADAKAAGDAIAAITPDDNSVGAKPWSSKQIIDVLCPPLEETGNPVQCYPVAGYPLGVKASWEPGQSGEGDPSPDNIRSITGLDEVQVTQCGKNLLDIDAFTLGGYIGSNGEVVDGHLNAASDFIRIQKGCAYVISTSIAMFNIGICLYSADKTTVLYHSDNENVSSVLIARDDTKDRNVRIWVNADNNSYPTTWLNTINLQIELGTTATDYAPYTGTTATLDLPSTVYGGEVDLATGVGTEAWECLTLDNPDLVRMSDGSNFFHTTLATVFGPDFPQPIDPISTADFIASNFKSTIYVGDDTTGFAFALYSNGIIRFHVDGVTTLEEAKQFVVDNPITIAYRLATPNAISTTPNTVLALSGENVLITNADSLTVTGRADPINTIDALTQRVAALEATATNIPEV